MIPWPSGARGRVSFKTKPRQIELIDKQIDDANKVLLRDPVVQPLRKKRRLSSANTFDETRHEKPPSHAEA